jgi:hypothetical protein
MSDDHPERRGPFHATTPPKDPPGGQDSSPDVRTAVHATIGLLDDVKAHLATRPSEGELLLRVIALRSALARLRDHLEGAR